MLSLLAPLATSAHAQTRQVSASGTPAPAAPPPPPYSLPWQLRPVTAATVLRSDNSLALYQNAKDETGSTVASTFLASYRLTSELAPLLRVAVVQNSEPGD